MSRKNKHEQSGNVAIIDSMPKNRYRVGLDCPTPVARNPLEVEALDPEQAKQRFLAENRLSDSEWEFTVERID